MYLILFNFFTIRRNERKRNINLKQSEVENDYFEYFSPDRLFFRALVSV